MNKADKYLKETITEIMENGLMDKNPRPKWPDGTPAHSKFVTQKIFKYNILLGEFPITTLRTTALKNAFHDVEAIYLKQVNYLEAMHFGIHSWWKDFSWRETLFASGIGRETYIRTIGKTYGDTVKRYNLMDKLLKGLETNPFGRRHKINLWQEQQVIDDSRALEPCAGMTLWSVREESTLRYIDLTLIQRSQDFIMTSSINPAQYCMLAMMVCNHLTFKTGIEHRVGNLLHIVQNCHIYDRHMNAAKEILARTSVSTQPEIKLICEPKDFYSHNIEDFKFLGLEDVKKLDNKLEIAL